MNIPDLKQQLQGAAASFEELGKPLVKAQSAFTNVAPQPKQRTTYITPDSKAGRSLRRIGKSLPDTLTPEQKAWNAEVDAKKARKGK